MKFIYFGFFFAVMGAYASEPLYIKSVYSRGNDDLNESNHETARVTLELVVREQPPTNLNVTLLYSAVFSVDHPHNSMGDRYWLKQRSNEIEPNLTAEKFSYTPGPTGTSLGGKTEASIFLGEFHRSKIGPLRGKIAITLQPDFDPNSPVPLDSTIDWGFLMVNEKPQLGELSLRAQWKGTTRPAEDMLRLIASNFTDPSAFRPPFKESNWFTKQLPPPSLSQTPSPYK